MVEASAFQADGLCSRAFESRTTTVIPLKTPSEDCPLKLVWSSFGRRDDSTLQLLSIILSSLPALSFCYVPSHRRGQEKMATTLFHLIIVLYLFDERPPFHFYVNWSSSTSVPRFRAAPNGTVSRRHLVIGSTNSTAEVPFIPYCPTQFGMCYTNGNLQTLHVTLLSVYRCAIDASTADECVVKSQHFPLDAHRVHGPLLTLLWTSLSHPCLDYSAEKGGLYFLHSTAFRSAKQTLGFFNPGAACRH